MINGSNFSSIIILLDDNGDPRDVTNLSANAGFSPHSEATFQTYSFDTALANGSLTISFPHVSSANLEPRSYIYTINLIDSSSNTVTRIQDGILTVTASAI